MGVVVVEEVQVVEAAVGAGVGDVVEEGGGREAGRQGGRAGQDRRMRG